MGLLREAFQHVGLARIGATVGVSWNSAASPIMTVSASRPAIAFTAEVQQDIRPGELLGVALIPTYGVTDRPGAPDAGRLRRE